MVYTCPGNVKSYTIEAHDKLVKFCCIIYLPTQTIYTPHMSVCDYKGYVIITALENNKFYIFAPYFQVYYTHFPAN
jgi:hypothetical protein